MEPIDIHWPTAFQAAQHWEVIDHGQLPVTFYQFLLAKVRQGAKVSLVCNKKNAGLQDQFFLNFEDAGGALYLFEDKPPAHAISWLYVDQLMYRYSLKNGFEQVSSSVHEAAFRQVFVAQRSHQRHESDIRFYTVPEEIKPNDSFELCWDAPGADWVQIAPLVGSVAQRGRKRMSTDKAIRFTLEAQYGHKSKSATTDISIDPKPKIEYLLAIPDPTGKDQKETFLRPQSPDEHRFAILERQAVRLYWRIYHAEECSVENQIVPPAGNMFFHPADSMSLFISAKGPHGSQSIRIEVDVFNRPVMTTMTLPAPELVSINTNIQSPSFKQRDSGVKKTRAAPSATVRSGGVPKQKGLRHFLWFCAGADSELLDAAPLQDRAKYAGIGGAVFFTGLLAAVSGGYALYTAFDNPYAAILFALLWGAVIFNIDRLIVSSIRMSGGKSPWRQALPRVALALIMSVVIAKPVELRIFEPEIQEILTDRKNQKLQESDRLYQQKMAVKQAALDRLKTEEQNMFAVREALYQEYRCECDGTCGTGKTGEGSECKRKEAKYRQADAEYQERKQENDKLAGALRHDMKQLQGEALMASVALERAHATGLAARLDASGDLPFWPGFFISLLVFLIEIAPIMSKMLAPAGVYEAALEAKARRYSDAQAAEDAETTDEEQHQTELRTRLRALEIDQEVAQHRSILQMIADAQAQVVKKQVQDWMEKQKGE